MAQSPRLILAFEMTAAVPIDGGDAGRNLIRAAQYVRMSTEHQKYSTENQADVIAKYAAERGFEIVRTYEDSGKSGLKLDGRQSLQRLIADVSGGKADFAAILVYDVSRWGRFQNADEPAHYEFICSVAGITVHCCAEQFENDGSIGATLIKSLKADGGDGRRPPGRRRHGTRRAVWSRPRPVDRRG